MIIGLVMRFWYIGFEVERKRKRKSGLDLVE